MADIHHLRQFVVIVQSSFGGIIQKGLIEYKAIDVLDNAMTVAVLALCKH